MLLKMANEELKHKEKMEYLYANTAFPANLRGMNAGRNTASIDPCVVRLSRMLTY
ncbi:MAG: hypothetical protein MZU91_07685 [Desulfosudis oleivorans]|nr:hypothetical protein [Desulfosudis oleivorans]